MRNILVLNSGSKSLKCSLGGRKGVIENPLKFFEEIQDQKLDAIGHRVVQGGSALKDHTLISTDVLTKLEKISKQAPMHMNRIVDLIHLSQKFFPKTPQVACFDSHFHQTIPERARLLGITKELHKEGVYKNGYHGLSIESVLMQMQQVPEKLVVAHLGGGSSVTAVKGGKSIDTTMSFTPLGGVPMQTRCGDIDPGVILYLLKEKKMTVEQVEKLVSHESGLRGVSGKRADPLNEKDSPAADFYCYHISKAIAAFLPVLGGIDRLVFTGGIGEHNSMIRRRICAPLFRIGMDPDMVDVIPAEEEKVIEKHALGFI